MTQMNKTHGNLLFPNGYALPTLSVHLIIVNQYHL